MQTKTTAVSEFKDDSYSFTAPIESEYTRDEGNRHERRRMEKLRRQKDSLARQYMRASQ